MKKVSVIIAIAALFMFVSCGNGGKKSKKGDDAKVDATELAKQVVEDVFSGDSYSKEAAEYWFKKSNGIALKDVAPDYALDESSKYTYYGDKFGAKANFKMAEAGEYTVEDHVANVRRIFAKTAAISDNGKNVVGFGSASNKEEAMQEADLEKIIERGKPEKLFGIELYIGQYSWNFVKDGLFRVCTVSLLEKKVDGNDVKCGYAVEFNQGLQQSWSETEKMLEENLTEENLKKAAKEYNKKN